MSKIHHGSASRSSGSLPAHTDNLRSQHHVCRPGIWTRPTRATPSSCNNANRASGGQGTCRGGSQRAKTRHVPLQQQRYYVTTLQLDVEKQMGAKVTCSARNTALRPPFPRAYSSAWSLVSPAGKRGKAVRHSANVSRVGSQKLKS